MRSTFTPEISISSPPSAVCWALGPVAMPYPDSTNHEDFLGRYGEMSAETLEAAVAERIWPWPNEFAVLP